MSPSLANTFSLESTVCYDYCTLTTWVHTTGKSTIFEKLANNLTHGCSMKLFLELVAATKNFQISPPAFPRPILPIRRSIPLDHDANPQVKPKVGIIVSFSMEVLLPKPHLEYINESMPALVGNARQRVPCCAIRITHSFDIPFAIRIPIMVKTLPFETLSIYESSIVRCRLTAR
jgi:hypothetical protein